MASAGSNVILNLDNISGTTATIIYSIATSGRYEDGFLVVFDENDAEVSRTNQFRAYGNASGSTVVTGIVAGHAYTIKFYSSDLGVYSTSTVEIDLRSGNPAYSLSSSATGTSVSILVSPIFTSTMGVSREVTATLVAVDGAAPTTTQTERVVFAATDEFVSVVFYGLEQDKEYTFSVEYYDPGLATMAVKTVIIDTAELDTKIVPKLYGEVENETQLVDRLYGEVSNEAQRVNRLYGSVNNQTKLIHLGVRHLDYTVYGTVTYYTNSAHTETRTAPLLSQEEVNSLHGVSGTSNAWSAIIGNGTATVTDENICGVVLNERVTSIPQYFLRGCTYLTSINISEARLASIPDYFMIYCKNFNSSIVLPNTITSVGKGFLASNIGDDVANIFNQNVIIPEGVTSIGNTFLSNNVNFNSTITLPSTLTNIGFSFLYSCRGYNKDLTLPQGITSIDSSFLAGMGNMTSTVNVGNLSAAITPTINLSFPFSALNESSAAYTIGIRVAGAKRAEWLSKYANSSSYPYRKLIDAGY